MVGWRSAGSCSQFERPSRPAGRSSETPIPRHRRATTRAPGAPSVSGQTRATERPPGRGGGSSRDRRERGEPGPTRNHRRTNDRPPRPRAPQAAGVWRLVGKGVRELNGALTGPEAKRRSAHLTKLSNSLARSVEHEPCRCHRLAVPPRRDAVTCRGRRESSGSRCATRWSPRSLKTRRPYALVTTVSEDTPPCVTMAIDSGITVLGLLTTLGDGLAGEVRAALAVGSLGGFVLDLVGRWRSRPERAEKRLPPFSRASGSVSVRRQAAATRGERRRERELR